MPIRKTPAHRVRRRPPYFRPVPLRARTDGWTVARQCGFLAALYVSGSVSEAARSVGMTPKSAYRLRTRAGAESFSRAWQHVLSPPGSGRVERSAEDARKVTDEMLIRRVETDFVQPLVYRGEMIAMRRKPDNSALLRLVRRQGIRWNSDCSAGARR